MHVYFECSIQAYFSALRANKMVPLRIVVCVTLASTLLREALSCESKMNAHYTCFVQYM